MFIKWLEVEGFRCFQEPHRFEFGELTEILGENGQGKSSILESITFVVAGADKEGKANSTDRLMTKVSSEMRLSIGIEVNGQAFEIERQAYKMKNKTETKILINRLQGNQEQIDTIIGDRKHFLASFLPDYFCSLEQKDARAELMMLLPVPTDEEVKNAMAEEDPELVNAIKDAKLNDPDFYIQREKTLMKELKEELLRLEGQGLEIKTTLAAEIPDEVPIDVTPIQELKDTIKFIESAIPKLTDISELVAKRQRLLTEYSTLQKGLVFDEKFIECDNCGHKINLSAEQDKINEAITEQMTAIMEEGKSVAAEIDRIKVQNDTAMAEFEKANAETLHQLREELRTKESNLKQVEQHNMRIQMMRENQSRAKDRMRQIAEETSKTTALIDATEKRIKAAQAYNVKRCEMQVAGIESILDRVSIRLFDIVKSTGEIKPVFKMEYDGKEYRVLSTSEKIRCGLEIAKLMRTLTKRDYPVFIDCAESITEFEKPKSQLFTARVVKGQSLTVKGAVAV